MFGFDASICYAGHQTSQSPRGIGGVEENTLSAGGERHRLTSRRGHYAVAFTDLVTVELHILIPHRHPWHPVEQLHERGAGVGHGTGIDTDHPLGTEVSNQSRHRRARTKRDHDIVKLW